MKPEENIAVTNTHAAEDAELLALREQVRSLKERLSRSNITTQKIMRKAMQDRSSWLGMFVKMEIITLPIITLVFLVFAHAIGASLWPAWICLLIGGLSVWCDCYTMRISTSNILTLPMTELKEQLIKQKRYRLIQTVVEVPITLIWLWWFYMSIRSALPSLGEIGNAMSVGVTVGMVVGTVIALIVIVVIYRKAQHTNDTLIETIDSKEEA